MDSSSPRIAVVGTGMIAAAHVRAARDAGAEVVGVLGSRPARSRAAADEWRLDDAYSSMRELLAASPDVVHICTPNATHVSFALEVVRAGRDVVVEKPIAMDVEGARVLSSAVEDAGVLATVPFVYRYHPMVREIRARRISGELGDLHLIHGSYLQDWLVSPDASTWRVDPEIGGASRAFADIGSHWCDLAEFISGERMAEASAILSTVYPTRPVEAAVSFSGPSAGERADVTTEDTATVTFITESGITVNTVISQVSAGRKNRLWIELDGSRGAAVFDQERPESAWFGGESGSMTVHRGEGSVSPDQARLNRVPAGHPQGWPDAFAAFCADAYAARDAASPPEGLPTVQDGLRSAELVDAVLASHRTRSWVPIAAGPMSLGRRSVA